MALYASLLCIPFHSLNYRRDGADIHYTIFGSVTLAHPYSSCTFAVLCSADVQKKIERKHMSAHQAGSMVILFNSFHARVRYRLARYENEMFGLVWTRMQNADYV